MKLDSKYFDKVRIKPRGGDKREPERNAICEWPECGKPGLHKAPKGRGMEGQYVHFCLDHVKDYNKAYNYFDGMPEGAVLDWQKDARTGHRPTWKLGENSWATHRAGKKPASGGYRHNAGVRDPFTMLGEDATASGKPAMPKERRFTPWGWMKPPPQSKSRFSTKPSSSASTQTPMAAAAPPKTSSRKSSRPMITFAASGFAENQPPAALAAPPPTD